MRLFCALLVSLALVLCALPASAGADYPEEPMAIGIVDQVTGKYIDLITVDGTYTFDTGDAPVMVHDTAADTGSEFEYVLVPGDTLKVFYSGDVTDIPVADLILVCLPNLIGTVKDVAMSTVQVASTSPSDTNTYSLSKEQAAIFSDHGVVIGDEVELYYEGYLEATDTTRVVLETINVTTKLLSGKVTKVTQNALAVSFGDKQYIIPDASAPIYSDHGLQTGDAVEILYTGDLNAAFTVKRINVTAYALPAAATRAPELTHTATHKPTKVPTQAQTSKPTPAPSVHTISGKVTDVGMSAVQIITAKGNHYAFDKGDATITPKGSGIDIGDSVTIKYTGSLSSAPIAKSIVVSPKAETTHSVSGTVTYFVYNTLNIQTAKGNNYAFKTEGVRFTGAQTANEGDSATITYTGSINDDPTPVAIKITPKQQDKVKTATGVVESSMMSTITFRSSTSNAEIIIAKDGDMYAPEGVQPGYYITVKYTGKLNDSPRIISIAVTP